MTRCPLRRCKWAKDGHCLMLLSRGWCPNQKKRENAYRRHRLKEAARQVENQEQYDAIWRRCDGQENP